MSGSGRSVLWRQIVATQITQRVSLPQQDLDSAKFMKDYSGTVWYVQYMDTMKSAQSWNEACVSFFVTRDRGWSGEKPKTSAKRSVSRRARLQQAVAHKPYQGSRKLGPILLSSMKPLRVRWRLSKLTEAPNNPGEASEPYQASEGSIEAFRAHWSRKWVAGCESDLIIWKLGKAFRAHWSSGGLGRGFPSSLEPATRLSSNTMMSCGDEGYVSRCVISETEDRMIMIKSSCPVCDGCFAVFSEFAEWVSERYQKWEQHVLNIGKLMWCNSDYHQDPGKLL